MKPLPWTLTLLFGAAALVPVAASGQKDADGFVPLFNGKDLTGWVNVNGAPGTFYVKDNQIITTGRPTGFLRTDKQYENFIMEFDWMHVPAGPGKVGNSGCFVWADPIPAIGSGYTRGIEVQVLVNLEWKDKKTGGITASSHGDIFSIWGAKCVPDRPHPLGWERSIPSEFRAKGANEWNHYRIEANDGTIKLAVNGKVVSSVSKCMPRKGYLALESEGSECRFKNLKIKELPSTNPRPDEIADVAQGYRSLYTGLDLSGWKAGDEVKNHWQPRDTVLHYDGKGGPLTTDQQYRDAEFIVDVRFPNAKSEPATFYLRDRGVTVTLAPSGRVTASAGGGNGSADAVVKGPGGWNRLRLRLQGDSLQVAVNGNVCAALGSSGLPARGTFAVDAGSATDFANLFVRELK